MPTEAQINANRLNAKKSTGPTSPEGKARSSLNALKSGIDAWSHIIPGEDPAELEALTEQFLFHYQPADPVQLSLVDTLISTEWIQRRLRRIEAQLWNYRVECLDKNLTRAEFIDISFNTIPQSATPTRTRSIPLLAFSGALMLPIACSSVLSKLFKTSRPLKPAVQSPDTTFLQPLSPFRLNYLSPNLASFRQTPLYSETRTGRPGESAG